MQQQKSPEQLWEQYFNLCDEVYGKIMSKLCVNPDYFYDIFILNIDTYGLDTRSIIGVKLFPDEVVRVLVEEDEKVLWFEIERENSDCAYSFARFDLLLLINAALSTHVDSPAAWVSNERAVPSIVTMLKNVRRTAS